jgi:hypothetical protein
MRLVVPVLLTAACGSSAPKPAPPEPVVEQKATRVPIEDESKDNEPQEEGVTFTKTKGAMSKEAIEAGLAPHTQALSDCYMQKVGKRKWLGGHIVLHWDIKGDGSISSVKMQESDLGSWEIEKCLLDIAWTATFEKPAGGDADFTVPLEFAAPRGTQIWDEDKALRAVGGQLAAFEECDNPDKPKEAKGKGAHKKKAPAPKKKPVEEPKVASRPEPHPPSNVVVTVYVGPQGKAQSVGFSSMTSELGDKWTACATQVAMAWRLPDPRGQIAKLAVKYKAE